MRTLVLANAILESSLYFISGGTWPTSCQHQSWDATCQAATWAGTQPPPTSRLDAIGLTEPPVMLGPDSTHFKTLSPTRELIQELEFLGH